MNRLAALAETAHRERDPEKASMVFNGAALVASDCGDADLARVWCRRHAHLYLSHAPLDGYTARFALEPVVNLARLRIREGDGDGAHRLLTDLYETAVNAAPVRLDGLELHPRHLPTDPSERDQLISWIRTVLIADGTRALTLTSRWADAVTHIHRYNGLGPTLLDGRQVSIVAHLVQGQGPAAAAILNQSKIEQEWEALVGDLLHSWSIATVSDQSQAEQLALIDRVSSFTPVPGLAVFSTRIALTALDLLPGLPSNLAASLIKRLVTAVIHDQDANPARVLLNHPALSRKDHQSLAQLVKASGLSLGHLPDTARHTLSSALNLAGTVIATHQTQTCGRHAAALPLDNTAP
ncbi:hypothetical protein [Micromonospora sp. LOL_023]|uniref:hypothetical protein n=1 Tax=Micromonospora sp. LOL_023 TaxID=3345418 RepID=UPI003A891457